MGFEVHTCKIFRLDTETEATKIAKGKGERRVDENEGWLRFSSYPLRGSSLVSIKPSAFTAGAASSDPGGFAN